MIQPIPARGMRPSRIEIKSITERNSPPHVPTSRRFVSWSDILERACLQSLQLTPATASPSGLERCVNRLAVLGSQGDFLRLFAEFLMNERDGVIAGRQALDLKLAVRPGDCEERALRNVYEHPHPWMLVALHGQHDFLARKRLFESGSVRGLGFVALTVVLRSGMDIVGGGLAVDDRDRLAGDHSHHVRVIAAAALIELNGFLGDVEGTAAEAFLDVDEDVREMAVRDDEILGHVRALAGGVLAHVNLGSFRRGAIEFHDADDDGSRGWVNRGGGSGRRSRSSGLLFGGFFLAAACDQCKPQRSGQTDNRDPCSCFHDVVRPLLSLKSQTLKTKFIWNRRPLPACGPSPRPRAAALPA